MNGLLVVDKPAGPTSHDIVRRMRRVLNERSVGHTGTLDPMATGVLVLVLGRATRLAKFLSAGDKSYEAVVTLGVSTDTYDAEGEPVGEARPQTRPRDDIDRALDAFRGTFIQQPPAFSAKKIDGERSYRLARAGARDLPDPVSVTAHRIELVAVDGEQVTLTIDCSAGFYVRSLAHDLGRRLGTGAHLSALRRTRSGDFTLAGAFTVDMTLEQDPEEVAGFVIPMGQALTGLPSVVLSSDGVMRAAHGRDLALTDFDRASGPSAQLPSPTRHPFVRLLDGEGGLVGIAEPADTPGLLHPSIVLV